MIVMDAILHAWAVAQDPLPVYHVVRAVVITVNLAVLELLHLPDRVPDVEDIAEAVVAPGAVVVVVLIVLRDAVLAVQDAVEAVAKRAIHIV